MTHKQDFENARRIARKYEVSLEFRSISNADDIDVDFYYENLNNLICFMVELYIQTGLELGISHLKNSDNRYD